MKFKFETGEVIECFDNAIANLLRVDKRYEEVLEKAPEEKAVTKEELLEKAKELGLEVKSNISKANLEKLIKEAEENASSDEDDTPEGDDSNGEVQE